MSKDLGPVQILGADSVGQPGQRRFRLYAQSPRGSVVCWIEKEQLNTLAVAIDRALAQITEGQVLRTEAQAGQTASPISMPADFPRYPDYDFQVAQISLAYNESTALFQIIALPLEIEEGEGEQLRAIVNEEAAIEIAFSQSQAQDLTKNITTLVSSGRPVCPLCGTPLMSGEPHACVKQNGHRQIVQVIEGDDEE